MRNQCAYRNPAASALRRARRIRFNFLTRDFDGAGGVPLHRESGPAAPRTRRTLPGVALSLPIADQCESGESWTSTLFDPLSKFNYEYTLTWNISSWKKQLGPAAGDTSTWVPFYDASDQLRDAAAYGSAGAIGQLLGYGYDDAGNRTSKEADGKSTSFSFGWEHRAFWGENLVQSASVTIGDANRHMGGLLESGVWVRLVVPAGLVGMDGETAGGMAFALYDGRAWWDRSGLVPDGSHRDGYRGTCGDALEATAQPVRNVLLNL
ncbi:hypothetical protein BH23VER1_BH23VER1_08670 [soil metagenome]